MDFAVQLRIPGEGGPAGETGNRRDEGRPPRAEMQAPPLAQVSQAASANSCALPRLPTTLEGAHLLEAIGEFPRQPQGVRCALGELPVGERPLQLLRNEVEEIGRLRENPALHHLQQTAVAARPFAVAPTAPAVVAAHLLLLNHQHLDAERVPVHQLGNADELLEQVRGHAPLRGLAPADLGLFIGGEPQDPLFPGDRMNQPDLVLLGKAPQLALEGGEAAGLDLDQQLPVAGDAAVADDVDDIAAHPLLEQVAGKGVPLLHRGMERALPEDADMFGHGVPCAVVRVGRRCGGEARRSAGDAEGFQMYRRPVGAATDRLSGASAWSGSAVRGLPTGTRELVIPFMTVFRLTLKYS